MKKRTIWILCIVMGASFLILLFLQISYIEEMAKMRNEQFDESVKRALMSVSKDVEAEEMERWLREDLSSAEKNGWTDSQNRQSSQSYITAPDGSKIELRPFTGVQQDFPSGVVISRNHGARTIPQTTRTMADMLKNRYLYQKGLMEEVVWEMIYYASDRPLYERVNYVNLDQYLKSGLADNGINLTYHFKLVDADGREIYRCSDYSDEGSKNT